MISQKVTPDINSKIDSILDEYLYYIASECNEISLAVVRKSEIDLRRALTLSPHAINETNTMGQTALHLAVDWPAGMHTLLEAGADIDCKDYYMMSPLDYAVRRSLVEPIHILVDAGRSLEYIFDGLVLKDAVRIEQEHLIPDSAQENVVDLLVDLIIERRQRLGDLAIRTLPAWDLAHFFPHGNHNSYLVDEHASQLFSELPYHGVPVPSALDPGRHRTTVYHHIQSSSRVAERLWKRGFRDIDGKNSLGLTPLMCMGSNILDYDGSMNLYLECVAWFLKKGANFYAKQDLALYYESNEGEMPYESRQLMSATSLHFVACKIGLALGEYIKVLYNHRRPLRTSLSETSKRVLERIVVDNVSDDCRCSCSINGCKAFTLMSKRYNWLTDGEFPNWVRLWAQLTDLIDIGDPLKSSEFLRLMTFKKLGLTHTCCRFGFDHFSGMRLFFRIGDQVAIDEIHEEEAADLQKLEELLEEFEAKRIELDLPFMDFLKEYWRPRMDEVLREGELDEEALKELGVRVYESDEEALKEIGVKVYESNSDS